MISLLAMEHMKLYNEPIALPIINKCKGFQIMLCSPNETGSLNTLRNMNFKNIQQWKYLFVESIYRIKYFNKEIKENINNTDYYKKAKEENDNIKYTFAKYQMYNNNNLIHDIFRYNEMLFKEGASKSSLILLNEYLETFEELIEKYSDGYSKIYFMIDLNEWSRRHTQSDYYTLTNAREPLQFIMQLLHKNIDEFKSLGVEFLFVYKRKSILVKPSECTNKSYDKLKNLLISLKIQREKGIIEEVKKVNPIDNSEVKVSKEKTKKTVETKISNKIMEKIGITKYNFNGESLSNEVEKEIMDVIDNEGEDLTDDEYIEKEEELVKKATEKIDNNPELLAKINLIMNDNITSKSKASTKRDQLLAKRQAEIRINKTGKTLKEILEEKDTKTIEPMKLDLDILNDDMKTLTFPSFAAAYNNKLMKKDRVAIFNDLSTKRIPAYITSMEEEDTSTSLDKKITVTVNLETPDRVRHKVVVDLPKIIDNKFLWLGGNKKNIVSQFFLNPISKTAPAEVQICTNYNKVFVRRTGGKLSPKVERLKKNIIANAGLTMNAPIFYKVGDNSLINNKYKTTIEYDEIASNYMFLSIKNKRYMFYFNQDEIRKVIKENNIQYKEDDNLLPICIKDGKQLFLLDTNKNEVVGTGKQFSDFLIDSIDECIPKFKEDFTQLTSGKRFIYTDCTIMAKRVPTILLLSYLEGLSTILKKANIKFEFSDTRKVLTGMDKTDKEIIAFKDGYLIYDRYPYENSLLLNGLSIIPTKDYNYEDMDIKETYLKIFEDLYDNRMILNAFESFYDSLIDPITKEVLETLNLPTEFADVFIYANNLLGDNQFIKENKLGLYRLRNNEVINAILYENIAKAYSAYRTTAGSKNPTKISIPRDCVIKDLLLLNTVEDYSSLNPVLEAEKHGAVSFKGKNGLNLERAYTLEKRAYDKSMRGIVAMSSPPSGSVGLIRQLAFDINVTSPRGFLKISDDDDESMLDSSNMFCISELLTTGCAQQDDAPRVAMVTTQTKHVVPCEGYEPLMITNGADRALGSVITNDFIYKAKDNGKIVEKNDKVGITVVKYDDGTYGYIESYTKIYKNGGGGFLIPNNMDTSTLKVGQRVKKNEILGVNPKYFDKESSMESVYKGGVPIVVALAAGSYDYEDSNMITKRLSDKMRTDVSFQEDAVLGKNANVLDIVKVGDHVEVGDPLLVFDTSYDDETINKLLASLSSESKNVLDQSAKQPIKAKHAGEIVAIECYYTVDKSELSESLRKVVNQINKPIEERRKVIDKYEKVDTTDVILPPTEKTEAKYGKVKGVDVGEGVVIFFTINHSVPSGVADKMVCQNALKATTSRVTPEGCESYTESGMMVDVFLSPISYLARKTESIMPNGFGNRILIERKKQLHKIWLDNQE